MISKYRIEHKSVLIAELKLSAPSISLNVFLYNGSTVRPRLIFVPKNIPPTNLEYKVFAESLISNNSVRVSISRSDYRESWDCIDEIKSVIEKESLKIMSLYLG